MTLLIALACSDYDIVSHTGAMTEPESHETTTPEPDTGTYTVTTDAYPTEDTVTVTTPPETEDKDDDGCWFGVTNGAGCDSDGDGEVDTGCVVGVKTIPDFSLLSSSSLTVVPGEDVILDVGISSYNECGDMDFHLFFFGVYDFTENSDEWLKPLNDDAVPSDFADLESGEQFPSYAAENMYVTPTGDQLFYVWKDEETREYYGEVISTQRVEAIGERLYRFTWTASEYAPLGRTFQISLTGTGWTDVATGTEVYWNAMSLLDDNIEIDVMVTE